MPEESDDIAEQRKAQRRVALECPECFSHRAEILKMSKAVKACCLDCDRIYAIKCRTADNYKGVDQGSEIPDIPPPKKAKPQYHGAPPDELPPEVEPPTPADLGPLTEYVTATIQGGAKAHRAAQREAKRLAARFGTEFEAQWLMETPWLKDWLAGKHPLSHRQKSLVPVRRCDRPSRLRVRAIIAMRARFLMYLATLGSQKAACRKARCSHEDISYQLKNDPDFMAQAEVAHAYFVDLLHMRAAQRAIEGDCEPVFWQGIEVGHVRKFDSRLQIEMLRAHMPEKFKTPGTGAPTTINGDVLVLTEEARAKLIAANRERIMALPEGFIEGEFERVVEGDKSEPHEPQ
jgi:hypothetical protein